MSLVPWFDEYLITAVVELGVLLLQDQVEGQQRHEQPVAHVPEHHREQEGEGDDRVRSCQSEKGIRETRSALLV